MIPGVEISNQNYLVLASLFYFWIPSSQRSVYPQIQNSYNLQNILAFSLTKNNQILSEEIKIANKDP